MCLVIYSTPEEQHVKLLIFSVATQEGNFERPENLSEECIFWCANLDVVMMKFDNNVIDQKSKFVSNTVEYEDTMGYTYLTKFYLSCALWGSALSCIYTFWDLSRAPYSSVGRALDPSSAAPQFEIYSGHLVARSNLT